VKPRIGIDCLEVLAAEDVLVLAAVVALPWFYGGVGLGAYRAAAAIVAIASGWALARRGASGLGFGRNTLWLMPAFLLGVFAFAQAVPLPRSWIAAMSPVAAAIQGEAYGPPGDGGTTWLRRIEDDARARVPEGASIAADPANYHWFLGNGMVHGVRLEAGQAISQHGDGHSRLQSLHERSRSGAAWPCSVVQQAIRGRRLS
jgi:hypothetical protein